MAAPVKNRLRLERLTFDIRQEENTNLLVMRNDRSDLPHLTISFNNPGKTINLHLTRRTVGNVENREDIVKIPEAQLGAVASSFLPIFLNNLIKNLHKISRVRPGWLVRKGYVICYLDENAEKVLLDHIVPARRYHGKDGRFLRSSGFDDYINSGELEKCVFSPCFLHELAASGFTGTVVAVQQYKKHKPQILPIARRQGPNGNFAWLRMDRFTQTISTATAEIFTTSLQEKFLSKGDWARIYHALQLGDLGFELT